MRTRLGERKACWGATQTSAIARGNHVPLSLLRGPKSALFSACVIYVCAFTFWACALRVSNVLPSNRGTLYTSRLLVPECVYLQRGKLFLPTREWLETENESSRFEVKNGVRPPLAEKSCRLTGLSSNADSMSRLRRSLSRLPARNVWATFTVCCFAGSLMGVFVLLERRAIVLRKRTTAKAPQVVDFAADSFNGPLRRPLRPATPGNILAATGSLLIDAQRDIDTLWNGVIKQHVSDPLSDHHRLWLAGAAQPPARGKLLLHERTGLILAVTSDSRSSWRTGENLTIDITDVASRGGGAVLCAGSTESHNISIWVGVSGPELVAGVAEQERASIAGGGCLQHRWRFRFQLALPGRYVVVAKLLFLNGGASFDNSKCADDWTGRDFVGGEVVDAVRPGKFYRARGSCCELCTRDPRCHYWKTAKRGSKDWWFNTSLRLHPGVDRHKLVVRSMCTLYASIRGYRPANQRPGRLRFVTGAARRGDRTVFLGCGRSFRPHTDACGVPTSDDAPPLPAGPGEARGPGTLDVIFGGWFHMDVAAVAVANEHDGAGALLAAHTRPAAATPACMARGGPTSGTSGRLPPRGRWVRLDRYACDPRLWDQTMRGRHHVRLSYRFTGAGGLPLVHDTRGETKLCYFQAKLGVVPWTYGAESIPRSYRKFLWRSPLLVGADLKPGHASLRLNNESKGSSAITRHARQCSGEGVVIRKGITFASGPSCVATAPLVWVPYALPCAYPPLPRQPLLVLSECYRKRHVGLVTVGGMSLANAFFPYLVDFMRGVGVATQEVGLDPHAADNAVRVEMGSSWVHHTHCPNSFLTSLKMIITEAHATGKRWFAHVDSLGSPHLLWHKTLDEIKNLLLKMAACYDRLSTVLMAESENSTNVQPPLMFWLNMPAVSGEREPHMTIERSYKFNAVTRTVLAPRGWIEIDVYALSMGLTFDIADRGDGLHMLGLPMKVAARIVAGALCDEPMTGWGTAHSTTHESILFEPKQAEMPCCSFTHTRCNWTKTPPFTIPPCEQDNLLEMLQFVQRNVQVDWWLTKGALLGAIRNKGHIPHETDIDVAVNGSQWRKFRASFLALVKEKTHFVFKKRSRKTSPDRLYFGYKNRLHVDFWLAEHSGDYVKEVASGRTGRKWYTLDREILYPLSQCEYEGKSYLCPRQSVRWLELQYGSDWDVPKPKYSPTPSYVDGEALFLGHWSM